MNLKFCARPVAGEILRRVGLAAARFGLREAGALLRASAPLVVQAGAKLQALSEHPNLQAPSPFFRGG